MQLVTISEIEVQIVISRLNCHSHNNHLLLFCRLQWCLRCTIVSLCDVRPRYLVRQCQVMHFRAAQQQ